MAVACAFWWAYFDVVALMAAQRLEDTEAIKERNELARDGYSYLHLPLVAAIVLVALGMKSTLAHVGDPLAWETAAALVGGAALYLLGHVAFKLRTIRAFSAQRLVAAVALTGLVSVAHEVSGLVTVALVATVLWGLLAFEAIRYSQPRRDVRDADHQRHEHHEHS
jgi:low temperature requirement protein LtrA